MPTVAGRDGFRHRGGNFVYHLREVLGDVLRELVAYDLDVIGIVMCRWAQRVHCRYELRPQHHPQGNRTRRAHLTYLSSALPG